MFHPEQQLLWQLWIKGFLLEVGQATFGFSFDFVPNNFTIDFVFVFTYVSHKKFENEALPRALTHKTIFQPLNIPSWSVERGFFQSLYTYGPSNWYWKKIWSSFLYPIAAKWLVFALSFETHYFWWWWHQYCLMVLSGQLAMKAAQKTWPCLQVIVKVCVPCGFNFCINATT